MKFRCERDALLEALSMSSRAVSSRGGALPVLAGVRLVVGDDKVTVCGTDLDLTIVAAVPVSADENGTVVVPAKLAVDIIRSMEPGSIEFASTATEAVISGGRSQFTLHTLPSEEFPNVEPASGEAHDTEHGVGLAAARIDAAHAPGLARHHSSCAGAMGAVRAGGAQQSAEPAQPCRAADGICRRKMLESESLRLSAHPAPPGSRV